MLHPSRFEFLASTAAAGRIGAFPSLLISDPPALAMPTAAIRVSRSMCGRITFNDQTTMAHPMHLHGHRFQSVAISGERFAVAKRTLS